MVAAAAKEAAKDITPPALVSAATLLGVSLSDWVLYLAIAYSGIRLLMLLPNLVGCATCFFNSRGCDLSCKIEKENNNGRSN